MKTTDPTIARWRAAAADDAAIAAVMDLLERLDALASTPERSRPGARTDLDQIARAADAARSALRSSSLSWAEVRDRAVARLRRSHGWIDPTFREFM